MTTPTDATLLAGLRVTTDADGAKALAEGLRERGAA